MSAINESTFVGTMTTTITTVVLLLCVIAGYTTTMAFAVDHPPPPLHHSVAAGATARSRSRTSSTFVKKSTPTALTKRCSSSGPSSQSTALTVALGMSSGGGAVSTAPPPPAAEVKPPPSLYEASVAAGTAKANASFGKIFTLGIVSGVHIGFGIYLAMTVGGNIPGIASANPGLQKIILGAFGLPFGLIMTLITGGELFTGNTAVVTGAYMEGKVPLKKLLKNWFASYAGNFVGSLLLAYLAYKSGTLGPVAGAAEAVARAKVSMPFDVALVRGILCNWLVCMAVYMSIGCSSMIGKMIAVWFPISAFVALGLDHSVANMCLIPLAMFRGGLGGMMTTPITAYQFLWKNLLPVTIGNIIGGALCVIMPFGITHGKWFK